MVGAIKSVHFVGICGTAMASVAAALKARGYTVTGSDQNVYPPMSTFLTEQKIPVIAGYDEKNLASNPDLVIIGNAISRGNPEAEAVLERKLRYCSLPELLKESFIRGKRSLVVTGTHGKTTTTSLLTWVFEHNGKNPSYLIGGIPNNFQQGARFTDSEFFIIEGDEDDTAVFDKLSKFLRFSKTSMRIILAAFAVSLVYNVIGLTFAVQGLFSPIVSAILMPISSLSVIVFATLSVKIAARRAGL